MTKLNSKDGFDSDEFDYLSMPGIEKDPDPSVILSRKEGEDFLENMTFPTPVLDVLFQQYERDEDGK